MSEGYNPFDLEANAEDQAARKERLASELRDEIGDLKWLMSQKRGRRVVHRTLAHAGMYRSGFSESASVMSFNEGQRNTGLRLVALLIAECPEDYLAMLKEKYVG
jgi:hypothetical protein